MRRDPIAGFAEIASGLIDSAHRLGRPAVTTVGRVVVEPNFPGIIPARVKFTVDVRHPHPRLWPELYSVHERLMQEVADRRRLGLQWQVDIDHSPCASDPGLVDTLNAAARARHVPTLLMTSGAAHDTQQIAAIAKVAMLFVRSKDGRSHTPEEFSSIEDIVSAIGVLTSALHRLAYADT